MARLNDFYKAEVAPALMTKFGYKSVMQIPKLDKIVINVGAGEAKDNAKVIDSISGDLATITGQKPIVCRAKKSVANFKLREGMPIGVKVTLRGEKMWEFMDRLFNVALPRVPTPSTAEAITAWVSKSSSSSLRSSTIRSTRSAAWMCASLRRQIPMKRAASS